MKVRKAGSLGRTGRTHARRRFFGSQVAISRRPVLLFPFLSKPPLLGWEWDHTAIWSKETYLFLRNHFPDARRKLPTLLAGSARRRTCRSAGRLVNCTASPPCAPKLLPWTRHQHQFIILAATKKKTGNLILPIQFFFSTKMGGGGAKQNDLLLYRNTSTFSRAGRISSEQQPHMPVPADNLHASWDTARAAVSAPAGAGPLPSSSSQRLVRPVALLSS